VAGPALRRRADLGVLGASGPCAPCALEVEAEPRSVAAADADRAECVCVFVDRRPAQSERLRHGAGVHELAGVRARGHSRLECFDEARLEQLGDASGQALHGLGFD